VFDGIAARFHAVFQKHHHYHLRRQGRSELGTSVVRSVVRVKAPLCSPVAAERAGQLLWNTVEKPDVNGRPGPV